MNKILLYYHTIKYLKLQQIWYLIFGSARKYISREFILNRNFRIPYTYPVKLAEWISKFQSYENKHFTFLNKAKTFPELVDWNFQEYGALWQYNLNYFEFLCQPNISRNEGVGLIFDFITQMRQIKGGMDPYPISLRGINWIKFISRHKEFINQEDLKYINQALYKQYLLLSKNTEIHLQGNHLLENGFSLLFGAYYFRNNRFYKLAETILKKQLNEQVLNDGAHFELSPTYHKIILERLLDCINLLQHNSFFRSDKELYLLLVKKAEIMLAWLDSMTFRNGKTPCVNDATEDIASSKAVHDYAKRLKIQLADSYPDQSGYRLIRKKNYELFFDMANVEASYQPGHTHADVFNFILHYKNKPIIVDTGVSTYGNYERRQTERATFSHNTVEINNENNTQIWGVFRLGKRPTVKKIKEEEGVLEAEHNGYKSLGVIHKRRVEFDESIIHISDQISGGNHYKAKAYIHFHPDVGKIMIMENNDVQVEGLFLSFNGVTNIKHQYYYCAKGFNQLVQADCLVLEFQEKLSTKIKCN
jgi:hypothetical protein